MDTFELMRSAYFTRGSNNLPDLHESVPRIDVNFYMWLACRKQQWRKHRTDKRARQQLTPEEDFPRCGRLRGGGGRGNGTAVSFAVVVVYVVVIHDVLRVISIVWNLCVLVYVLCGFACVCVLSVGDGLVRAIM